MVTMATGAKRPWIPAAGFHWPLTRFSVVLLPLPLQSWCDCHALPICVCLCFYTPVRESLHHRSPDCSKQGAVAVLVPLLGLPVGSGLVSKMGTD